MMFYLITKDSNKNDQVKSFGSLIGICSYIQTIMTGKESYGYMNKLYFKHFYDNQTE